MLRESPPRIPHLLAYRPHNSTRQRRSRPSARAALASTALQRSWPRPWPTGNGQRSGVLLSAASDHRPLTRSSGVVRTCTVRCRRLCGTRSQPTRAGAWPTRGRGRALRARRRVPGSRSATARRWSRGTSWSTRQGRFQLEESTSVALRRRRGSPVSRSGGAGGLASCSVRGSMREQRDRPAGTSRRIGEVTNVAVILA